MAGDQAAGNALEDDEEANIWVSFGTALRLIVGWFCIAIGALNLLVEIDRAGAADGPYLLFHAVLLVGGIVLLALAWIGPRPGVIGFVTGGVTLVGGTLISAIPATTTMCCMSAFPVRHGFPYTFLARGDGGDRWHVDSQHLLADLLFWGYVGLLLLILVALVRPTPEEPAPEPARHEAREYIEKPETQHPRVQQD